MGQATGTDPGSRLNYNKGFNPSKRGYGSHRLSAPYVFHPKVKAPGITAQGLLQKPNLLTFFNFRR